MFEGSAGHRNSGAGVGAAPFIPTAPGREGGAEAEDPLPALPSLCRL